jgi:hypothetical protein
LRLLLGILLLWILLLLRLLRAIYEGRGHSSKRRQWRPKRRVWLRCTRRQRDGARVRAVEHGCGWRRDAPTIGG